MNPTVANHPEYRRSMGLPPQYPDLAQEAALSDLIERASRNAPTVSQPSEPPQLPPTLSAAFEVIGVRLLRDDLQANADLVLELSNLEQRIAARLAEQTSAQQSEVEQKKSDLETQLRELVANKEALHGEVVALDIRIQEMNTPLAKAENALAAAKASEPKIIPHVRYPHAEEHEAWRLNVKRAEEALKKIHEDIAAEQAARQELLQDLADAERQLKEKEAQRQQQDDALNGIFRHGGILIKEKL